jgi:hypothetical protein
MNHLSETVLRVTTKYLGPAAPVFLARQAKSHMGGLELDHLLPEHLPLLLYWIGVSSSLVIDEKSQALLAELSRVLNVRPAATPRG